MSIDFYRRLYTAATAVLISYKPINRIQYNVYYNIHIHTAVDYYYFKNRFQVAELVSKAWNFEWF